MASACISAPENGSSYSERVDETHFGYVISRQRCGIAHRAVSLQAMDAPVLEPSCPFRCGHRGVDRNRAMPELKQGRDDEHWLRPPPQNTVTLEPKIGRLA
jgi:hypothetical protein